MTTTIISNGGNYTYGSMTNQAIGRLISLNSTIERLGDAIATASSGYTGVAGTQFEIVPFNPTGEPVMPNLFGVQPSATPGEQGEAYSYALGRISEEWAKFWTAAEPFIEQLDNGTASF